jgi:peroxiredoxin
MIFLKKISLILLIGLGNYASIFSSNVVITCNIQNQLDSSVTFSYTVGLLKPIIKDTIIGIKNDKTASFALEITQPTTIRVIHDYRYFDVYCEPGDAINLSFDAQIYPTEITFSGNGAVHNKLLHSLRQNFVPVSNKLLLNKINTTSGLEFRKFMDGYYLKKWDFCSNFSPKDKENCSISFDNYLQAEINYWYAYYLMRYREEHSSVVSDENIYLPDAYYDFLNNILINDEASFVHQNYTNFLKLYYEFRKNHPDFPHGLASRQVLLKSKRNATPMFLNMECAKQVGTVDSTDKLLVLDKTSFNSLNINGAVAYCVKVKTQDNRIGWIRANLLKQVYNTKLLNNKALYINNLEINYTRDVVDCKSIFDSLGLFSDPADSKRLGSIAKGSDLSVMGGMTADNVGYSSGSDHYASPFSKVRSKYGTIGWVPSSGIQMHYYKKNINEWQSKIADASATPYLNLDYFYYGKTLFFVYGLEIREKIAFNGKFAAAKNYGHFMNMCQSKDLKDELAILYRTEDKRFTFDSLALNLNQEVLDQRTSSLNKRTNLFELASAEYVPDAPKSTVPIVKNTPEYEATLASVSKDINPVRKSEQTAKKKVKQVNFKEPQFAEVKYEYKPITLIGKKKLIEKYQMQIILLADPIQKVEKIQLNNIKISKGFFTPDTFTYKIKVVEPITGYLKTKNDSIALWLEPGQKYNITEKNKHLRLEGEGASAFEFINDVCKYNKKIEIEIANAKIVEGEAFKTLMAAKLQEKNEYLQNYNVRYKLPGNLVKHHLLDNEYWYFNKLLLFPESAAKTNIDSISYYDFVKEIKIQNERALQCPEYQSFIKIYLDKQIMINEKLDIPDNEVARMTYSSKVLKYWQVNNLIQQIKKEGLHEDLLKDIQTFNDDSSYPLLTEALQNAYHMQTMSKIGYKVPDFSLTNANSQKIELNQLNNKVIFIHFWSIKQKAFEKEFEKLDLISKKINNPNVIFIKINTDNNPILWKKAIAKFKKDKYQLFTNDENIYTQNLSSYFKLGEKPSNIVISKRGNLVKNTETEMQESELMTLIRKELSRK